jgi:hypothetical protein
MSLFWIGDLEDLQAEISFTLVAEGGKVDNQVKSSSETHPPLRYSDMPNADVCHSPVVRSCQVPCS